MPSQTFNRQTQRGGGWYPSWTVVVVVAGILASKHDNHHQNHRVASYSYCGRALVAPATVVKKTPCLRTQPCAQAGTLSSTNALAYLLLHVRLRSSRLLCFSLLPHRNTCTHTTTQDFSLASLSIKTCSLCKTWPALPRSRRSI